MINPFLNARTDAKLKELLGKLYKKYNYDIPVGVKARQQVVRDDRML